MAKEKSKKFWALLALLVFVSLNYVLWLDWSENIDRRLKALESRVGAEPTRASNSNKIREERQATLDAVSNRYICVADNAAYFTQNPDQQNCRINKLDDGWKNLFFSKEQIFDYYEGDLSRTGNEVKVWSRILFNSPKINAIQQYNGMQNKIEFDELKSLLVFNCSAREYKNPNIVYFLDGEELLRTTGNRTTVMSNGLTSYSYDDITEQIEPGTFVETLYKAVCS